MIAASAGVLAVQQRNRAATQRQTADARRLAAASAAVRGDQLDLAALLAIESRRLHRDAETSSSLFSAINEHPGLRAYLQHRRPETAAAIDPTGHYLVDQGAGRATLEVWDLQQSSPSLIRTISLGQTAQATAMLFFHDGKLIVGDDRGSVSVVDPLRGVTLSTSAQHHQGPVRALSFAPDEETIASGGDDGLVRFTLRTTGAATRTPLVVDGQPLEVVAFSSDGGQLAVGSDGGSVFFWDTTNWSVVKRPLEVTRVRSFDWSPDGQRFVVGSDEGMQFYDAATRSVVGDRINAHDGSVLSLQYFNNGREVVSAGADGRVLFWDATTHQPTRAALVGHASAIRVALSDTAKLVATPSDDGRVGIWDLTGRTLSARPLTSRAGFIAALGATSDGMLIGGDQNGTLTTWDREGEMKGFVDVADAAVTALALSDDGKRAVVAASDGSVRIVDPSSGAISSVLPTEKRPPVVGISPDGRWVATATRGPDCIACVRLYDTDRPSLANRELRTLQRTPKTTGHVEAVAFDPTSTILATGDGDGWVDLWSLTSGRHLWGRRLPRGVRAAAFSPRGHQLAVGASSGVLVVINTADGTVSRQLRGHRGDVSGAAFSPNGTLLATTSLGDHELRVWNMATGLTADSLTFGRPAFLGLDDSLAPTWPDDAHVAVPHTKTGAMLYALDDTSLLTQACALARRNLSRAEWMQYLPKRETYRRTCPAFPAEVLESRSS